MNEQVKWIRNALGDDFLQEYNRVRQKFWGGEHPPWIVPHEELIFMWLQALLQKMEKIDVDVQSLLARRPNAFDDLKDDKSK